MRAAGVGVMLALLSGAGPACGGPCPSWQPARIFGQLDLGETGYNEVVPNRVFHPGGLIADRLAAPQPSRIWIWDAGNNRILGLDHVGTCAGGPAAGVACTENSGCAPGSCTGALDAPAALVLGQPAGTGRAACNGDNLHEAPAAADTLCAVPFPHQVSVTEGPRGNSMAVDARHRLYVVDPFNNRVLRFDDPFSSDTSADRVWGQPNFHARACNRGLPGPTAETLCTGEPAAFYPNYYFSAGLDVTPDGSTLWIADLGNHRVLRVPAAAAAADLVLGQDDFASAVSDCTPPYAPDRLCKPNAVRYDPALDRLYVLDGDAEHARIVVFDHPATNGQLPATILAAPLGSAFHWPRGLTLDPLEPGGLWVSDTDSSRLLQYVAEVPARVLSKGDFTAVGCLGGLAGDGPIYPQVCNNHGSVAIDRDGSIYTGDLQEQHVARFPGPQPLPQPGGVAHSPDALLLDAGTFQGNQFGPAGLANPGYALFVGSALVVADRQRILFWNDYAAGPLAGGPAAGVLGQPDFSGWWDPSVTHGRDFTALEHDPARQILYAAHGPYVSAWSTAGGLVAAAAPLFQFASPLPLAGGGSTPFEAWGLAVDPATDSAWLSDEAGNRILRVLDVSQPARRVDAILGQPGPNPGACNRGLGPQTPVRGGFCLPTQVKRDRLGNLYVVDGTWEGNGNQRAVEYDLAQLPPVPSPQLFWATGGPQPSRVYAKPTFGAKGCDADTTNKPCTPRFVCFEPGTNRMILTVDGYGNPLDSRAFLYDDPLAAAPAPQPTGRVPLRFAQAAACDFDAAGRAVILDHTWNRALLIDAPPAIGANADGDLLGDGCDCAPAAAAAWAAPGEIADLVFDDPATLGWGAPEPRGGTGLTYTVLRAGLDPGGAPGTFAPLATGLVANWHADAGVPAAGAAFLYLVQPASGCP